MSDGIKVLVYSLITYIAYLSLHIILTFDISLKSFIWLFTVIWSMIIIK